MLERNLLPLSLLHTLACLMLQLQPLLLLSLFPRFLLTGESDEKEGKREEESGNRVIERWREVVSRLTDCWSDARFLSFHRRRLPAREERQRCEQQREKREEAHMQQHVWRSSSPVISGGKRGLR